jgi:hypothetical protein
MHVYLYIYMYTLSIYIYVHINVQTYIYIYIYIYIHHTVSTGAPTTFIAFFAVSSDIYSFHKETGSSLLIATVETSAIYICGCLCK